MTLSLTAHSKTRSLHDFLAHLTDMGWLCTGLAGLGSIVYLSTDWTEFLAASAVALLLLFTSFLLSLGNIRLSASMTVGSSRLSVGESTHIVVEFTNTQSVPTAVAQASVAIGSHTQSFRIPRLAARSSHRVSLPFHASHREKVSIGPLTIRKTDPFGLLRREFLTAKPITIFIHPTTIPLITKTVGSVRNLEGEAQAERVDDDLFFSDLRPYEQGDDTRHIHWISTAKTGHLMVRQFQMTAENSPHLGFVTSSTDYRTLEEFELAVSTFASLGRCFLTQKKMLSFSYGSRALRTTTPRTFLDISSDIQPQTPAPDNKVPSATEKTGRYFYIFGSQRSRTDIHRFMTALPQKLPSVAIIVDSLAQTAVERHSTCVVIHLNRLADLPGVLKGLL